ncbi:hypothetical protein TRAPUB_6916 [Trametes pubescens]|uniref:Uncharacterized protein n=1 Tax=Trametes pubescens TaxID=154538 RepID=A0A1M2V4P8_TRAPU|nr:hypothetical protein TRAPUB_6916 [Trametes pubescens]
MSYDNVARSSSALIAVRTFSEETTLVRDLVHSQHAQAAALRHKSSMGSIREQEMWSMSSPQQHRCLASCDYVDIEAQVHDLEEEFLNFDECAEEDIPLPAHDSCCSHPAIGHHTPTQFMDDETRTPLLDTQTTPGDVSASPPHMDGLSMLHTYTFLPDTKSVEISVVQAFRSSYFQTAAAWEHAASSTTSSAFAPPTSSVGGHKRARFDEEEHTENGSPPFKKTRAPEEAEVSAPQSAHGESSVSDEEDVLTEDEQLEGEDEGSYVEGPDVVAVAPAAEDEPVEELQEEEAAVEAGEAPGTEEEEPTARAKRIRRTNDTVLKTTRRLPKVLCPVPNCARGTFDPYDHDANKAHLAAHLGATAVIPCLWPDCEETRSSRRLMFKHLTEGHIGLPYVCPLNDRCTWATTKSQWQLQHVRRNCPYRT